MRRPSRLALLALLIFAPSARGDDPPLAEYFRRETARIASKPLLGIDSADEWKARRPEFQRKLKAMLGLDPEPPRGDLHVEVRGTVERPDFVVEKIVYQSLPGLYVTGNVYRPKNPSGRLPAILYVCGHSRVEKDGVIYGSKAHYQHHAAWFAANGYVCLIVDTLELGEVPGEHHGVYSKGRWWWYSRGYTPAGVEAWNGVRGIDYLVSRPDVDPTRIGVTGRSGGGATSWWLGAIDDRIAAVCPVAGITDLEDHVVNGVVEGHCDCMYFVNTERWDYTMLAALVAPKPLLVENTDKDPIFPEAGVRRIFAQLEKVYGWYGARDRLSLIIGKGGHADTEELRHPAFAFFERWLKNRPDAEIVEPDRKVPIEELRVLSKGETFADSRNATIDETFIPKAETPKVPASAEEWERRKAEYVAKIKDKVVRGWPTEEEAGPLGLKLVRDVSREGLRLRRYEFQSQPGIALPLWVVTAAEAGPIGRIELNVMDERRWNGGWREALRAIEGDPNDAGTPRWFRSRRLEEGRLVEFASPTFETIAWSIRPDEARVFVAPRGVGPTAWPKAKDTNVRRRFALLGQTLGAMQAFDIRRAIAATREVEGLAKAAKVELRALDDMAAPAALAGIFEPGVTSFVLSVPDLDGGPELLNAERLIGAPQLAAMLHPRPMMLRARESALGWLEAFREAVGASRTRIVREP